MNCKSFFLLMILPFLNYSSVNAHRLGIGKYTIKNEDHRYPNKKNEDAFSILQGTLNHKHIFLFAVFDGHGGTDVSSYLEDYFGKIFFKLLDEKNTVEEALKKSIEAIEECILDKKLEGGSTLVAAVYDGINNRWVTANVGDSRALLSNLIRNNIRFSTIDHNIFVNIEERKRVEKAGGIPLYSLPNGKDEDQLYYREIIPEHASYGSVCLPGTSEGLMMSRCIGDIIYKPKGSNVFTAIPDIRVRKFVIGDCCLLATDGFWDAFTNEQAHKLLMKYREMEPNELAKKLCEEAILKVKNKIYLGNDDTTVIVVKSQPSVDETQVFTSQVLIDAEYFEDEEEIEISNLPPPDIKISLNEYFYHGLSTPKINVELAFDQKNEKQPIEVKTGRDSIDAPGKGEDAFIWKKCKKNDSIYLYAVFDGHSGKDVSLLLKKAFANVFYTYLNENNTIQEALRKSIKKIEKYVLKEDYQGGSTLVAVVADFKNRKWITANVGDSRAILVNVNTGKLRFSTKDHNPYTNEEERTRFHEAGGIFGYYKRNELNERIVVEIPYRYARKDIPIERRGLFRPEFPYYLGMSRSIGDRNHKPNGSKIFIAEPEIEEHDMYIGDRFLLASDGLWDVCPNEEARDLVLKHSHEPLFPKNLCLLAKKRWLDERKRLDDITVLVVKVCQAQLPPNAPQPFQRPKKPHKKSKGKKVDIDSLVDSMNKLDIVKNQPSRKPKPHTKSKKRKVKRKKTLNSRKVKTEIKKPQRKTKQPRQKKRKRPPIRKRRKQHQRPAAPPNNRRSNNKPPPLKKMFKSCFGFD